VATVGALLLTPGAGADRDHRTLVALESTLPVPVRRIDFPYRLAGRKAPDRAPVAVAHVVDEATRFVAERRMRPGRLALGGRSFGGRMCSMAVAEGLRCAGLVLLSYPLHPPGKPDKLRVGHFGALTVPCLFISGEKDPFATPDELARETRAIPGPVDLVTLRGGHEPKGQDDEIADIVGRWLTSLR